MEKLLVLLMGCAVAVSALSLNDLMHEEWNAYKLEYWKNYENISEDQFRMNVYLDARMKIAKHNQLYELGEVSFAMGINQFSDLSHQEFVNLMFGQRNRNKFAKHDNITTKTYTKRENVKVPDYVDWREEGAVTPVKDQGSCGSCFSFAATGAMESMHFIKTGELLELSEQNILDCSKDYGNKGCDGGNVNRAFQYVIDNGGIETEDSYPYEQISDNSPHECRYDVENNSGVTLNTYERLPTGDETSLIEAISEIGPIAVNIDASHESFQHYKHDVYYEPACRNGMRDLDHSVLAIGYGTDGSDDYYIIKNSWGDDGWGEGGYMKLARNRNNHCGVATDSSYPV